jgi:hypothetical protein
MVNTPIMFYGEKILVFRLNIKVLAHRLPDS